MSTRLRSLAAALLAAALIPSIAHAAPAASAPTEPGARWRGEPTLIGGTARYDRGEWVFTDFVFDDYGADTGPAWGQPNVSSLASTSGDARYPAGLENAADIVEVRARAIGRDLQVRVLLQTLTDAEQVAVWAQVNDTETIVTSASKGADIDTARNTVTFTVPGAAGDDVTLNVGAGLHDGDGGLRAGVPGNAQQNPDEITTGAPTDNRLFDVAFNTHEIEGRGGHWNEDRQSAALASGDLEQFAQTVAVKELRDTRRRPAEQLEPGYYVRLFKSRMKLGEGLGDSFPQYLGRWQPYALWIPEGYDADEASPFFLNLHSLSSAHNQYRGDRSPTYKTFYEQMGDGTDAIVATPLARGPDGWYLDEALVDSLEVWADVLRTFTIDREQVRVGGYSMGGYGTYRFSTLVPDAFASAVSVVGPPTDGIWTGLDSPSSPFFTRPQLENTRHVPFWLTHGVLDELVPVYGVTRQADRFAELGHEYRFALHPAEDHLSFTVKDAWSREATWFNDHPQRVTAPQRVTYKLRPASWLSEDRAVLDPLVDKLLAAVGARRDAAYWVGDVEVAREGDEDVTGTVDLASGGIARRESGAEEILTAGVDGPSPYRLTGTTLARDKAKTSDVLSGTLTNVSALTVDVGRARLSDSPKVDIEADRPVTITYVRKGEVVGKAVVG
jgi:dienelactone hydrolase